MPVRLCDLEGEEGDNMTSGKLNKKPSDNIKERLDKRALKALIQSGTPTGYKLSDSEKKSPSQRKSDAMRKKLARNAERSLK